jgi:hypothetical protein
MTAASQNFIPIRRFRNLLHQPIQNLEEGGAGNHQAIEKMEARIEKQEQESI